MLAIGRIRMIARVFLGLCIAACPQGAEAVTAHVAVTASVTKPLVLEWAQDLDLGSIALGPGVWSDATVAIARNGLFTCASANVTCSGLPKVAQYKVTGSNKEVVNISAPDVTLVNTSDPSKTLLLTLDAPASVTLPNSGSPGATFPIGGSIKLNSSTASGLYSGTLSVTVDY